MRTRMHQLRLGPVQVSALVLFMLVAAALFLVSRGAASPEVSLETWVTPAGYGLVAPACGSSSVANATPACSNSGAPQVTVTWVSQVPCDGGVAYLNMNGSTVASGLGCDGSYTWSGGGVGAYYTYEVWTYVSGSFHSIATGAFTEPAFCCVGNYQASCQSAANACGQVNSGSIACNGSCTAGGPPANSSCTPSVSCSVSPSSGYQGDPFTWSASASGPGSFSYSWTGTDGLSGAAAQVVKRYSTAGTKTGTVTVTSNYGFSASCAAAVNGVNGGPGPSVGACTALISPSSTTIDQGQSVTLAWSPASANCGFSACTFLDGGSYSTSGTRSVSPSTTSTYGITCNGTYGASNPAYATVNVLVPTASITANPQRVATGGSTTVTWTASNVNTCDITRNGTAWKSGLTADASRNVNGSSPDTITTQTTYVLTCKNKSAQAVAVTSTAVVNVTPGFQEF